MKKKVLIPILSLVCAFACALGLSACTEPTDGGGETYTVKFDAGRGTVFGERFYEVKVEQNTTVSAPNEDPVCEDYFFLGWNLTGDEDYAMWNFDTEKVTHDVTLYAVWARGYIVTFDADGGAFSEGGETYKVTVAEGSKISAPNVTPPDDNHALEGWLNGSSYWDFTTDTVLRDVTLKAEWTYSEAVATALAPFIYSENYGSITIKGVKDKAATSLAVPSVVSYVADNAFKDCANLETVVIDDSVIRIGESAFSGCVKLKTVTLPAGLNEIDDYTFNGCAALEEINVPNTLVSLGEGAFYGCSSLTAVELPAGVTKIPGSTFRGCTSLGEIKLGPNVTELGAYAFTDCSSLEEFEIPSGVTVLTGQLFEGCSALQSITVPATCTQIYQYAFKNSGLETAVIHSKKVDLGAFSGCASLVNLTIGAEVEELGQDVFNGCISLTEAEIPDTVTKAAGQTFKNCSGLKTVSIGNGLIEISSGMFSGCSALRNVEIGSSVSSIRLNAFANCVSLLSLTVPSTVTEVHNKAFEGCARLVEMYNLTGAPNFLNSAKPLNNTVIHTSATDASIIKTLNGFSFCTFRTNYATGDSLYLLDYSGNAESVTLPADFEGEGYKVFDYALSCNPQLKSVTFSAGVSGIGSEILFGSDNVTTLAVASGNAVIKADGNCIIDVANKKFVLGCITSVIPADGSVTAIGSNVFCHNKTIVNDAFKIPASVTVIESCAFDGIEGIARTEGYVRYVDNWAVGLDYEGSAYIDLEIAAGTVGIAESAFNPNNVNYSARKIKSVKTNAELKYICNEAFSFCDFITEVTLNNGLISIGGSAFGACSRLEEIVIPDTVTSLGSAAFSSCSALKYVKLPSNITELQYQTFYNCTALKTIVMPSGVTKLEHWVFRGCNESLIIYYTGDAEQWNAITHTGAANDESHSVTKLYYSDTAPSTGVAWHYGADGKPTTQY